MSSPCGKCNACPCGTNGTGGTNGGTVQHTPPPQEAPQQHQQQPQSCPSPDHCDLRGGLHNNQNQVTQQQQQPSSGGCQVNVYQPPPPSQQYQPTQRPHVHCTCTQNRQRGPAVQAPLADNYTCSRPPRAASPPIETRCNCREKPKKLECHCAPPVAPTVVPPSRYESQPPTHANVTCGEATYQQGPPPYVRRTGNRSSAALGNKRCQTQTQHCHRGHRHYDSSPRLQCSYSESAVFRRNRGQTRGRHCFVYRSGRPVQDLSCFCPQPRRLVRQQASLPCPMPGPPTRQEEFCYPQTSSKYIKNCCCAPPKKKVLRRSKACCPNGSTAVESISEQPCDSYRRNSQCPPVGNFDLSNFDRDAICSGGNGRRRNVSIRTFVDYDYDPGPSQGRRSAAYQPSIPNVSQLCRAIAPPVYIPNYLPGPDMTIQREPFECYDPRAVQSDPSIPTNNFEYDFLECPYR